MTCQHCCGAESIFDKKSAQRDLKRYLRKGPNNTTKILLNEISKADLQSKTLLDIGGGIGVIQHELLKKGLSSTTDVDASSAYHAIAQQLGNENETIDRMNFIYGDFIDYSSSITLHDIVTLERVVCCYPNVSELIKESTSKAKELYVLVYPADNFLSKLLIKLTHIYFWFKKNPFRTFIHSESMMHELIKEQGFELFANKKKVFWRIAIYKRTV